jgi:hypothetical protein
LCLTARNRSRRPGDDETGIPVRDIFAVVKAQNLGGFSRLFLWSEGAGPDNPTDAFEFIIQDAESATGLPAYAGHLLPAGAAGFAFFSFDTEINGLISTLNIAGNPEEGDLCLVRVRTSDETPLALFGAISLGSQSSAGTAAWEGEIVEIVAFDEGLSRQEAIGLFQTLAAKWALTVPDFTGAPPAPTDVAGLALDLSANAALVEFQTAGAIDLGGFRLLRRTGSSGPFVQVSEDAASPIGNLTGGVSIPWAIVDDSIDLEDAADYEYQLVAYDIFGNVSAPAGPVTVAPPPVVTGVATTPGVERVWLTWHTSGHYSAETFNIWRRDGAEAGPWVKLTSTPAAYAAAQGYLDDTAEENTAYLYAVSALSAPGLESDLSTGVGATTFEAIESPIRSSDIVLQLGTEDADVSKTGSDVDSWNDASAAENDFSTATANLRPEHVDLGGGLGKVIQFDSVSGQIDRLEAASVGLLNADLDGADGLTFFIRANSSALPSSNNVATIFSVYIGLRVEY